ncbi:MAG: hydroxymethylbilane synthase [Paraglaciecola sp.]|jgi:hydroxymethylbilane synthase
MKKIRIGTRGSRLALWQAEYTKAKLEAIDVKVELIIIKTKGDKIQHLGFDKLEGKGFFTKEIEDSLLRGDIDMAVHSMKDMPTTSADGLAITAVSYRENPADWMLVRHDSTENIIMKVKKGGIVGTSSARRKAMVRHFRPDVTLRDIRGNVPTRIEKLRSGEFDAILLAAAGVSRLELDLNDLHILKLNPKEFVPAPAQGVLAWQTTADDLETRRILKKLHQSKVSIVTNVERKILKLLGGGCHTPFGAYCERDDLGHYHVYAAMAETWESDLKSVQVSSSTSFNLAEEVLKKLEEA